MIIFQAGMGNEAVRHARLAPGIPHRMLLVIEVALCVALESGCGGRPECPRPIRHLQYCTTTRHGGGNGMCTPEVVFCSCNVDEFTQAQHKHVHAAMMKPRRNMCHAYAEHFVRCEERAEIFWEHYVGRVWKIS